MSNYIVGIANRNSGDIRWKYVYVDDFGMDEPSAINAMYNEAQLHADLEEDVIKITQCDDIFG